MRFLFCRSRGIVVFVIFLILLVPAAAQALNSQSSSEKIIKGRVYINDVSVGGMDVEQARRLLEKKVSPFEHKEVVFSFKGRKWEFQCHQLGLNLDLEAALSQAKQLGKRGPVVQKIKEHWQVAAHGTKIEIPIKLNKKEITEKLKIIGRDIEQPCQDAKYFLHGQVAQVVPHKNGTMLEYEHTVDHLLSAIRAEQDDKNRFEVQLSVKEVFPEITTEVLKGKSMTMVTGEYTTFFNTGLVSRSKNIATAVKYLDGTVIPPGATFSFNKTVGPRTKEAGFEEALIIVGQEFTPGLGGGVCQVSSTLYNAALKAGMKITERSRHSRTINYVPIGLDAAVSYGIIDLKFENTSDCFIAICGETYGGTLNIKILSENPNPCSIEINPIIEHTVEPRTETKNDFEIEEGKEFIENVGKNGYVTRVERNWLVGGKVFKREIISRDFYPAETRVIVKGSQKKSVTKPEKGKVFYEKDTPQKPAGKISP